MEFTGQFWFTEEPDQAPGEVPLPATVPLFTAGLGVIGLLCWRRKRKIID